MSGPARYEWHLSEFGHLETPEITTLEEKGETHSPFCDPGASKAERSVASKTPWRQSKLGTVLASDPLISRPSLILVIIIT